MKRTWNRAAAAALLALLAACAAPPAQVLTPVGPRAQVTWTEEELGQDLAARTLWERGNDRGVLIRLRGKEEPHEHPEHGLLVCMLSGLGEIHYGERSYVMRAGDVIEIPRGVSHWAENTHPAGSVAYVVFLAEPAEQ